MPLLAALDGVRHRGTSAVLAVGLTFGFPAMWGGYHWLRPMLEDFSGFGPVACLLLTGLLVLYAAGLFVAFSWLWTRCRDGGHGAVPAAVVAMVAVEKAYPILFPYHYGDSLHPVPLLISRHYNTAFLAEADGTISGRADKTYLLAFGEYLPMGERFPALYRFSPNSGRYTPATEVRALPLGSFRIGVLICYEDILPGFARRVVGETRSHLLVNLTNDAWFGDTNEPWIHLALAKLRAVEHRLYLARATNTGVSAVIDPVGRVVTRSGAFTRETLHAEVAMLGSGTPYLRAGDWPSWTAVFAVTAMAFGPARRVCLVTSAAAARSYPSRPEDP